MEREVNRSDGLAGFEPRDIELIETIHRFYCGIESPATGLVPRRFHEGKDREHAVAEVFQHLATALAQRSGKRLKDRVEQLDDDEPRGCVGDRCEAAHISVPQDSVNTFYRATLHRPGVNTPTGIAA